MYKKLDIDFELPPLLEAAIDRFVDYINTTNGSCEDCYRDEIDFFTKDCMMTHSLNDEQIDIIRRYYVWGDIYECNSRN